MATRKARPNKSTSPLRQAETLPASPLTTQRILTEALAQIDARGVTAFNLRDLAAALGVYPTAIYWHVPSRNDLIAGAVALALHDVAVPALQGDWRARLRTLFARFRAALQRHPHIAPLLAGELGSNTAVDLTLVDHLVAALEEAGFDGAGLVDAYNVVVAAMCGFATLELAKPPSGDPVKWQQDCERRLADLPVVDYPALSRHLGEMRNRAYIVRWTSGQDAPLDSSFTAWLDVIIGGLEQRAMSALSSRAAGMDPEPRPGVQS